MRSIFYKRLFEISILHEYHLSAGQDQRYFELPENERNRLLSDHLSRQTYAINRDLQIKPTAKTSKLLANHQLLMLPTPTGVTVAGEINKKLNNASEEEYFLSIPVEPTQEFQFRVQIINPTYRNITNQRLSTSTPANYYFTTHDPRSVKTYPSLSLPVSDFQAGRGYEMGELAVIGGALKQALEANNTSSTASWLEINDGLVVNENDRQLLPHSFVYSLPRSVSGSEITADLLNPTDNTLVSSLTFIGSGVRRFQFDFTNKRLDPGAVPTPIPSGKFLLVIRAEGSLIESKEVFLDSELYRSGDLATVVIQADSGNPQFKIFQANGALRRIADPITDRHPVFEVRLKSRLTYWRYLSNRELKLDVTPKTAPYLSESSGVLSALSARPLIAAPTEFSQPTLERVYLPNPSNNSLHLESDGRIYSNIYTSGIKNLIKEIE